ncbi:hypothetical protein [Candidatus Accumulibacter vicinus]|uniref:SnoaL-like domain-containing protein n=1 Tax=Candidatus Accumulibacter vicinus TaxID=2954382 RepID=A0A084Y209_9PROT|nr:hypothetical protein [Candidatus Accumulibacter vicinus]KFB68753.1 MAG: hypothetical protein CAPSK01_001607 [Candidatus Accumulibacter vicinus]
MDTAIVDELSKRFIRYLETGDEPQSVFAPDIFLDFTLPTWRIQAQGLRDVHDIRMRGHPTSGTVPRWSVLPTPNGFAMEAEERWTDSKGDWYCREAFFAEIREGKISRLAVYCTGDWDSARQASHRAQVTLLVS